MLQDDKPAMKGSMYLKMLGNELGYYELNTDKFQSAKQKLNFLDIMLALATGGQWTYNKNFMFIDSSFTVPTSLGLPLQLSVNGTASIHLSVSGKMDIRNTDNIDINGVFRPR